MTEKEEQLLQALLRWDNAEAPEAALILVKGIDQQLNRFHKEMLSHSLKMYKGERNDENRIELDSFIPYIRKESHIGGSDLTEFLIMVVLYHFHPKPDDNYLEFNELLGAFEPQHAVERMQELLRDCSIIHGEPELWNGWYKGYSRSNAISFFVQIIGACPEDLRVDESLLRSNITKLDLSDNELSLLPSTIGNLTSLEELFLWDNQLKELPSSIGNLTSLTRLESVGNQLRELPSTIGNLTSLTHLKVSFNQLSELPSTIGNLTSLTRLELNHNQLSSEQKQQIQAQFPFARV